ncbi:hypothetical protein NDN08_006966 [Rhodosorus marinus]|uniref:MARVEL domain-containing protein n=1 Tax=Rhodosorus marinus TaxID=101924 RepID=A0AAV8UJN6_9RHOD|nr:hypothetical protein NDN08_006966 [Rhodosorus marinus]
MAAPLTIFRTTLLVLEWIAAFVTCGIAASLFRDAKFFDEVFVDAHMLNLKPFLAFTIAWVVIAWLVVSFLLILICLGFRTRTYLPARLERWTQSILTLAFWLVSGTVVSAKQLPSVASVEIDFGTHAEFNTILMVMLWINFTLSFVSVTACWIQIRGGGDEVERETTKINMEIADRELDLPGIVVA